MLNEMFNTPDFKNVGAGVADDLGIAREDHARRMQLQSAVRARLAGNPMSLWHWLGFGHGGVQTGVKNFPGSWGKER